MKELQEIMNAKVLEMANAGTIQKSIEDKVEAAIQSAINDQFKSYGDVTKQIGELLTKKLKIDAKNFDIPTYNEVLSKAVNQKVNEFFETKAASRMMQTMDKLFAPLPEEMTLKTFVETICNHWKTDEPWDADDIDDYATVEFEKSDYSGYNLKMWKQKESSGLYSSSRTNSEDIHLYISEKGEIRLRHTWNPTILRDEDSFIVKAYASSVTLTDLTDFDSDDCDLTLKDSEY
ncbi:MAG: hypothetical protein ACJAUY_000633 [Cognaticolwellia sp.]|jgi:hypothetical protein